MNNIKLVSLTSTIIIVMLAFLIGFNGINISNKGISNKGISNLTPYMMIIGFLLILIGVIYMVINKGQYELSNPIVLIIVGWLNILIVFIIDIIINS